MNAFDSTTHLRRRRQLKPHFLPNGRAEEQMLVTPIHEGGDGHAAGRGHMFSSRAASSRGGSSSASTSSSPRALFLFMGDFVNLFESFADTFMFPSMVILTYGN
jgi:hypothetical protein